MAEAEEEQTEKRSSGEVRQNSDRSYSTRVRFAGKRETLNLLASTTREEANARSKLVVQAARRLERCDRKQALEALQIIVEAPARSLKNALQNAEELANAGAFDIGPKAPTFKDVAKLWTDGDLHREYPDHVKLKTDAAKDASRLAVICDVDVGGVKFGDVPVDRVTLDHAEAVMRALPAAARRPATRRHYAQLVSRVLALAVYPLRLADRSPLPKGFMPKVGKPPRFPYLYPSEDKALMACSGPDGVPLERRLLYGFLAREGCRDGEAAALTWADVDLKHGMIKLDANKTDDPRAWALDPGVIRALKAWQARSKGDRIFGTVNTDRLAERLRADLQTAGVTRAELFDASENRGRLRAHDLRGTFVTLSLANGKTETWVADRTGHRSSLMIAKYRRSARSAHEARLGELVPLDRAIPELAKRRANAPSVPHGANERRRARPKSTRNRR